MKRKLLDIFALDDAEPFELDRQIAHLFKHGPFGIEDIIDVWQSDPTFYPAKPPAHWLMVSELAGQVMMVPLAPSNEGNERQCRPIGCYRVSKQLAEIYRKDVKQ